MKSVFNRQSAGRRVVDALLAAIVVMVALVVWQDISGNDRNDGEEAKQAAQDVTVTREQLGQQGWKVARLTLSGDQRFYTVAVSGPEERSLFSFRIDAASGQVAAKGEEKQVAAGTAGAPMSQQETLEAASSIIRELVPGRAVQTGDTPFYEVPLTYRGREVASVKVDAKTRSVLPAGGGQEEKGRQEGPGAAKGGDREKESRLVDKDLVVPLGWLAVLIALTSTLYYSWKRSIFGPIRAVSGEAKARMVRSLRRTLWYHIAFGAIALGVAVFHVLNFWGKMWPSVSWLVLGMMATVVVSGAFGKFAASSDLVRAHWRRFHVPFTILFFMVLGMHILMKLHLLGGD